jgi:hypothetical protein
MEVANSDGKNYGMAIPQAWEPDVLPDGSGRLRYRSAKAARIVVLSADCRKVQRRTAQTPGHQPFFYLKWGSGHKRYWR